MNESPLSPTDVEDVDLADDALQDLIEEAETLMHDLPLPLVGTIGNANGGTTGASGVDCTSEPTLSTVDAVTSADTRAAINIGGDFSIDDDDDEVDNGNKNGNIGIHNVNDDPLRAAQPPVVAPIVQHELDDHPLSATSLSSPTTPPTTGSGNVTMPSTSTGGNVMSNMFNGGSRIGGVMKMNMNTGINMGRGTGSAGDAAAASMDTISKTTSMFASNLASMAQRGMAQVAAATAPVQVVNVIGSSGGMTQGQPQPHSLITGMDHHWSNGMKNNVFSSTTSTPISNYPEMAGSSGAGSSGAQTPGYTQLDKDQKTRLLKQHLADLFEGERVIMFLTNLLHVSDTSGLSFVASQHQNHSSVGGYGVMWCCVMTYYRLVLFSTADTELNRIEPPAGWDINCWQTATPPSTSIRLLEMPLASMDRVEKTVYQAAGSSYMGLVIYGKDCGRIIRFSTPNYADTGRAFESLNTYAFPGRRNLGYLFAFESKRQEVLNSIKVDEKSGQQSITLPPTPRRFDPMTEYSRLIKKTAITQPPWAIWTTVNSTYQLSQSYPSVLVGPASLDETKPEALSVIRQCSVFRKGQRLPSMAWCSAGGASIWRSSQPKVGLQGNRSPADELYLRHIVESARGANAMAEPPPIYPRNLLEQLTGDYTPSSGGGKIDDWVPEPGCGLKILDLRPRAAAIGNRTGGYGYENTSNYSNTTLQFCNIQNIHAVRDSYDKLCNVCNSKSTADVQWNYVVEDTKWLSHIRSILAASWSTAYWVHVWKIPVLLHCSHGWDRTSQVSCLSQLFLDSYYRTRHGFAVLVEKDFMSFGHPFHLRSAHGEGRNDSKNTSQSNDDGQISPIFLQFLDCVYQLVELYPSAFEFNTQYLLELSFHIYSCRFGNMLCDTEREREALAGIRQRTYSIWDYLERKSEYINEKYVRGDDVILMPLPTVLRNVKVWKERHFAYSPKPSMMIGENK